MISYLEGKVILKKEKFIVLEVNRVGYKVFLSQKSLLSISDNQELKIFCFLDVKENSLNLYGFLSQEELEFFEILDTIRGVGPKAALEISALGPLEKLKEKILAHDEKLFEKISGIGRKKAMTIILELSGKISSFEKASSSALRATEHKSADKDEVEDTLVNLGFPRQQAREVLKKIPENIKETEQRVKESLKILGRG